VEDRDHSEYARRMLRYYNNPSNDARRTGDAAWARYYRARYGRKGHWLREVALAAQDAVRGRRVLELACGHCRWTPFLAEAAEHVLATDAAPNMLEWGRRIMTCALPGAANVEFLLADAYRPERIPGDFTAATVMSFFQHVPTAQQEEFLDRLHARLGAGAIIFLAANHLSPRAQTSLFRKDQDPRDTYSIRHRPDGATYEIIDNVFDQAQIQALLSPRATDLRFTSGKSWWWVTYAIR
jgi:SAM-dependent methyltransferase